MAQQIASLYVELKAETQKLRSELDAIKGKLQDAKQEAEHTESRFAKLGTVVKGVLGAAIVQQIARVGQELVGLGLQAESARKTFEAMGGTTAGLDEMRQATHGMMDDISAMQSANQLLMMGLASTTDEAAKLASMAVTLGAAMGNDATTSMQNFALMLANQSILRLDTFGISSGRVRERIAELQKETKGLSREQAFMTAVMEEGTASMNKLGDVTDTTAAKINQQRSAWANLKTAMGSNLLSGGAIGNVNGALAGLAQTTADALNKMAEAGRVDAEFNARLKEMGKASLDSRGLLDGLAIAHNKLINQLSAGKITLEQYQYAMEGLGKSTFGTSWAMEQAEVAVTPTVTYGDVGAGAVAASMAISAEQVLPTREALESLGYERAEAAAQAMFSGATETFAGLDLQSVMADAMGGEAMVSLIAESGTRAAQIMADIQGGLTSVVQANEQQRADVQFNYQLQSLQARQEYESKYASMVAAGQQDDADKLKANFEYQQGMREYQYGVDEQLNERTLLIQKIAKVKAYIEELTNQADHIRRELALKLTESQSFAKLEAETQRTLLEIVNIGGSEKLKQEAFFAEEAVRISKEYNIEKVSDAKAAAEAILALGQGQINEAQATMDTLQAELSAFKVDLPPLPSYDALAISSAAGGGIGGAGGAASAARAVTEPATKALSDVTSQIAKGIADAKQAIADLLDMESPDSVDAGLDKFKTFVVKAVNAVYDLPKDTKERAKKLLEFLEPLSKVAGITTQFGTAMGSVAEASEVDLSKAHVWKWNLSGVISELVTGIEWVKQQVGKDRVKDAAEGTANIAEIAKLAGTDLSKITFNTDWRSFAPWRAQLLAFTEEMASGIDWVRKQIGPAKLKQAAEASKDIKGIGELLGLDLNKVSWPKGDFGARLMRYVDGLAFAIPQVGEAVNVIRGNMPDLSEVADAAGDIKGVADLLSLQEVFDKLVTDKDAKKPVRTLQAAVENLGANIDSALGGTDQKKGLMGILQGIRDRWGDALPMAKEVTSDIREVFENIVAAVTAVKDALKQGGMDIGGARTLFDQIGGLFDPGQGTWSAGLQNLVPESGYAGWQTARASREGMTGAPSTALPVEHTIYIKGDQGLVATITAQVLGAVTIAENQYLQAGLEGSLV
jgi:hypothetical protein